jgi:hypothetical protein
VVGGGQKKVSYASAKRSLEAINRWSNGIAPYIDGKKCLFPWSGAAGGICNQSFFHHYFVIYIVGMGRSRQLLERFFFLSSLDCLPAGIGNFMCLYNSWLGSRERLVCCISNHYFSIFHKALMRQYPLGINFFRDGFFVCCESFFPRACRAIFFSGLMAWLTR